MNGPPVQALVHLQKEMYRRIHTIRLTCDHLGRWELAHGGCLQYVQIGVRERSTMTAEIKRAVLLAIDDTAESSRRLHDRDEG